MTTRYKGGFGMFVLAFAFMLIGHVSRAQVLSIDPRMRESFLTKKENPDTKGSDQKGMEDNASKKKSTGGKTRTNPKQAATVTEKKKKTETK